MGSRFCCRLESLELLFLFLCWVAENLSRVDYPLCFQFTQEGNSSCTEDRKPCWWGCKESRGWVLIRKEERKMTVLSSCIVGFFNVMVVAKPISNKNIRRPMKILYISTHGYSSLLDPPTLWCRPSGIESSMWLPEILSSEEGSKGR